MPRALESAFLRHCGLGVGPLLLHLEASLGSWEGHCPLAHWGQAFWSCAPSLLATPLYFLSSKFSRPALLPTRHHECGHFQEGWQLGIFHSWQTASCPHALAE